MAVVVELPGWLAQPEGEVEAAEDIARYRTLPSPPETRSRSRLVLLGPLVALEATATSMGRVAPLLVRAARAALVVVAHLEELGEPQVPE